MRKAVSLASVLLALGASCLRPDPKMQAYRSEGSELATTGAVLGRTDLTQDAGTDRAVPRAARVTSRAVPVRRGLRELDRHAATAALDAMDLSICRDPFGQRGIGYVQVTFAPDGSVADVELEEGPADSPLTIGSPLAACVLAKARAVRVRPFAGAPVVVGHSIDFE